jgi:hypothetical protein
MWSPASPPVSAEHVYDTLYCARGQAENLIKMHKGQLASDRASCPSPLANQMRLILHTAAYWLMLTLCDQSQGARARKGGVCHHPPTSHQTWRTGDRDCIAHPSCLRCRLPRGRSHPASCHHHQSRGTMKAGAVVPVQPTLETRVAKVNPNRAEIDATLIRVPGKISRRVDRLRE